MNRADHKDARFFVGTEVERTAQFGNKTLFVVGVQSVKEILHVAGYNDCKHIYIGANMSFNVTEDTATQWEPWEAMVQPLLESGFWVTLDVPIDRVEGLLESGFTESRRFIPMISAKLPYLDQLGYNACIKLDDKDFDSTNPGVWVHPLRNLTTSEQFTCWDSYTKDELLD
tara:strand:- start:76 stop:588 length:513 start_codon:yes stop_codon:yes gene_type:complete